MRNSACMTSHQLTESEPRERCSSTSNSEALTLKRTRMSKSKGIQWKDVQNMLCHLKKSDEEIESYLPWFYENVKCFKEVHKGSFNVFTVKERRLIDLPFRFQIT